MKKTCNIVKDLLPSYAYNLTTDESNIFVEEHLKECAYCKKNLENIKSEEKITEEKKAKKYIKFAKKYQNKLYILRRFLIFFIIIVFAMILIPSIAKIYIISSLANKAERYASASNIHIVKYSYNDNSYIRNEFWQKDKNKKITTTSFNDEIVSKVQIYATESDDNYLLNCYSEVNGERTANLNIEETQFIGFSVGNIFKKENLLEFLKASIFATIKNTTFDGKECYYILNFDRENDVLSNGIYVDKETGLIMNEISYQFENEDTYPATSYIYEFDTVTEKDFIEPDISNYKIVNDN